MIWLGINEMFFCASLKILYSERPCKYGVICKEYVNVIVCWCVREDKKEKGGGERERHGARKGGGERKEGKRGRGRERGREREVTCSYLCSTLTELHKSTFFVKKKRMKYG